MLFETILYLTGKPCWIFYGLGPFIDPFLALTNRVRQPSDPVSSSASRVTLLLQLPTHGVTRRELADSWYNSARAGRLLV
jgi:hypothetical protein